MTEVMVWWSPTFYFKLEEKTLALIIQCADSHYDYKCRNLTKPGELLFKWGNQINMGAECTATSSDLDLVCKCLEMALYHNFVPVLADRVSAFQRFAKALLNVSPTRTTLKVAL